MSICLLSKSFADSTATVTLEDCTRKVGSRISQTGRIALNDYTLRLTCSPVAHKNKQAYLAEAHQGRLPCKPARHSRIGPYLIVYAADRYSEPVC